MAPASHTLPTRRETAISPARARYELAGRFNPLRGLTPQRVTQLLEDFDRGILREAAWVFDKVERTDYMCQTVVPKRKKGLARQPWDIVPYEQWEELGSQAQLEEQQAFLRHLYNSLRTTHALNRNLQGGVRAAMRQMADAIGKGFAVHELAWTPQRDGSLEVALTFVPLWFFENTIGELRFLRQSGAAEGEALEADAWMVTVCDLPLGPATLTARTYKDLPLKDWLTYSERCGMPFPSMATDAAIGSTEWDAAVEAIAAIASEYGAVHSRNAEFLIHDLTAKGQLPYPPLVELMDRALSMLWRGADLSTMSGDDRMGASLQQDESDILVEDDVDMINETFEHALSLPALRWRFGAEVEPLCSFKLRAPDRLDEKAEQDKLHAAADYGVSIPVSDYRERLSLPGGEDDEPDAILQPRAAAPVVPPAIPPTALEAEPVQGFANAAVPSTRALLETAALDRATQRDLAVVLAALEGLDQAETPEAYLAALEQAEAALSTEGPAGVLKEGAATVLEKLLADRLATAATATLEKSPSGETKPEDAQ